VPLLSCCRCGCCCLLLFATVAVVDVQLVVVSAGFDAVSEHFFAMGCGNIIALSVLCLVF